MSEILECPSCGAPLDYQPGHGPVVRCEYCENPIIVPEALHQDQGIHPDTVTATSIPMPGWGQLLSLKEIAQLARSGQTEEAVALFQQNFGVDTAEARRVVEAMSGSQPVMLSSQTQINLPNVVTISRPIMEEPQRMIRRSIILSIVLFVVISAAVIAGILAISAAVGP
jgi:hypothetical protein